MTLMTGTGLAQALPIALAPILTRLYTPEDFGIFALYGSICAMLTVLVTGKYDLAIVVPKYENEAVNLVALALLLSLSISLLLMALLVISDNAIVTLLGHPAIGPWLYLVPCATFILGCYYALNFWANRHGYYKNMAVSRVVQSGCAGVVQLMAGLARFGLAGLIVGQLLGQFVSVLFFFVSYRQEGRGKLRRVNFIRILCVARKYKSYPKFMVPGQVMNVGANELPLLLLTVLYGPSVAGLYSLAQRVMTAPLSLFANAIGDVYRQRAAEEFVARGECLGIFLFSFKRLFFYAFLPMVPILLFGPDIFAFVFGETWRGAGEIAAVVAVLMFFQTLSLPLSNTLLLRGWLMLDSIWQLLRVLSVVAVFYISYSLGGSYKLAIVAYVCVVSFFYMVHSFLQYKAARGSVVDVVA
ncbi:lipopolysaccharide biosynthesis protein [Pseudomonas mosselii]|uniref:lipopolysaccharide biosynthesis protein n=1 Tax=Pseudomonas mosselii TaxID=78327 RepID=UPI000784292B|nr:oligosaccharide flippase family protein [Pseudomonas mosselii]KXG81457.1 hypothetical protein AXZ07_17220 [Pseudomonas mosselii]MCH7418395.1 oligosaccharide flippase family protein [Pseudomonas mosselii]